MRWIVLKVQKHGFAFSTLVLTQVQCSWNLSYILEGKGKDPLTQVQCSWNLSYILEGKGKDPLTQVQCSWNLSYILEGKGKDPLTQVQCSWNLSYILEGKGKDPLTQVQCSWNLSYILEGKGKDPLTQVQCSWSRSYIYWKARVRTHQPTINITAVDALITQPAKAKTAMVRLSRILQCTTQNRNVHIFVLNGALWDKGLAHLGIYRLVQHILNTSSPAVLKCSRYIAEYVLTCVDLTLYFEPGFEVWESKAVVEGKICNHTGIWNKDTTIWTLPFD